MVVFGSPAARRAAEIPIVTQHRSHPLDEVNDALLAAAEGSVAGAALVIPDPGRVDFGSG